MRKCALLSSVLFTWCALVGPTLRMTQAFAAEAPGGADSAEGQTHTVQEGDTLWDLTARYLQNPWYWPKVWSYNPQLSNPHFIFPGQLVRFFKSDEAAAVQVQNVSAMRDMPPDAEGGIAQTEGDNTPLAGSDIAGLGGEARGDGDSAGQGHTVSVSGNQRLTYDPNKRGMIVQSLQLISEKELKESGTLERAFEDKQLFSDGDLVFLKWNQDETRPQRGAQLITYRMIEEVTHPVTGDDVGYLSRITGVLEVLEPDAGGDDDEKDNGFVTARLVKTYDLVERGNFVVSKRGALITELQEKPNTAKLSGVIITSEQESQRVFAQYHYVFVDRGTQDGLQNGNQLTVYRNRDYFKDREDGLSIPNVPIGKLLVVDAKEKVALALVMQSVRDMHRGDTFSAR